MTSRAPQDTRTALKYLRLIQALDSELDELKHAEASIPADLRTLRDEQAKTSASLEERTRELAITQRALDAADLELRDLTAKRDKAKVDQRSAASAKEQTQFENVIQQLSTRIEELEDSSFPLVGELETLTEQVEALKNVLQTLEPKLRDLESIDEERIHALQAQAQAKEVERLELAQQIDAKLLREYDAIRRSKKGLGLATIKPGGRCGGCNVVLPIHVQQRIHSLAAIVKCPSCGRIIWPGE